MKLREKYDREVLFMGGIDKHALIESPKAIDRELERVKAAGGGGRVDTAHGPGYRLTCRTATTSTT